jgi:Lar family restriction alleviation protein
MKKAKLKPCPFCGLNKLYYFCFAGVAVVCENCGSEGPLMGTKEAADMAWNRRVGK